MSLGLPSLEARRDRSSLLLFHKIHSGAVSIEKDKYLTPARSLKSTRSSHSAQYCRYQTYSDALKNSFSPGLFHSGIVFLLWLSIPRLLRSLGYSSFSKKHSRKIFFSSKFQNQTPWRNDHNLIVPVLKERKNVFLY